MFKMNTMDGYHNLYLKTDVLLLADVFEKFIKMCLEYYGLDHCHHFSIPGLSWDAMPKLTETELKSISNIDMYLLVEQGMRRSISYIGLRYNKANNKFTKCYDNSKPSNYIMYLDVNNLYGWGMSPYLPHIKSKWLNEIEI